MNGPTICRVSNGSTRRTLNPPKSRSRPPITCRLAMDCPYEPLPAAIMAKDRDAHREFGCFPHCGPFFAPGCFDVLTVDSKASGAAGAGGVRLEPSLTMLSCSRTALRRVPGDI